MKPDISEFSYGFALTSEIVDRYSVRSAGAPEFPSLISEGRPGGGYDVRIPGIPLFLQFKLSSHMVGKNAVGAEVVGVPHFRMKLRPLKHSRQHRLLLELERSGNAVYYAAPEFHRPGQLDGAYSTRQVEDKTAFFKPSAIGELPDEQSHHIAFAAEEPVGFLFSEPRRVARSSLHEDLATEVAKRKEITMGELTETLIAVYEAETRERPEGGDLRKARERFDALDYTSYLSRVLFDCQLLLPERLFDSAERS